MFNRQLIRQYRIAITTKLCHPTWGVEMVQVRVDGTVQTVAMIRPYKK
jgi:hypothetical protein